MAKLGKELWKKIEAPQGYSYLADSLEDMPDQEVIEMAEGALAWHQESARVLRAFLKTHLTKRAADGAKAPAKSDKCKHGFVRAWCAECTPRR